MKMLAKLKKTLLHFQMQGSILHLKSTAREYLPIHRDQRLVREFSRFRVQRVHAQSVPLASFRQSDRDPGHFQIAVLYRRLHFQILWASSVRCMPWIEWNIASTLLSLPTS